MKAALQSLVDVITDAVKDAECEADVLLTAGRPAAPSEEGIECQTVIYVFGEEVTDLNQLDANACLVRARWAMQYEIWSCYPEDWYDPIDTDDASTAADCLYELMDLVWCGLVEAKDSGDPFGDCEYIELAPLVTQGRRGGAVSALGGLTVPHDCTVTSP